MSRAASFALLLAAGLFAGAQGHAQQAPSATWAELRPMIYGDRAIAAAEDMIRIEAPDRAHDAATVPVELTITPPLGQVVKRFALIVEENPAPVAAEFEVGPAMGRVIEMATRIRVDAYTHVRVVVELEDGSLHEASRFVKASGGCSAPAAKDAAAAMAALGQMRVRTFDVGPTGADAQVMLRHPQYSGFQKDQLTHLYIPAHFVEALEVSQGGRMLFRMTGGISLSEDPSIRFRFTPDGDGPIEVRAEDTKGAEFGGAFPMAVGS